jgi:hypothetical protein
MPPPAAKHTCVVFYGKVGNFERPGRSGRSVETHTLPGIDMLVLAWHTVVRHIHFATMDHVGHSWSPRIGRVLDQLFNLRVGLHQVEETSRNRRLCQEHVAHLAGRQIPFAKVGNGVSSCERTASQLLSIYRAMQLKARLEHDRAVRYDSVLLCRWDLVWSNRLRIGERVGMPQMPPRTYFLPQGCVSTSTLDSAELRQWHSRICGQTARVATIGGGHSAESTLSSHKRTVELARQVASAGQSSKGAMQHRIELRPMARAVWQLDWWLVSGSVEADAFAEAGSAEAFSNHTVRHAEILSPDGAKEHTIMGHTIWGLHLLHRLDASLRFAPMHRGVDFALARHWSRDGCLPLTRTCQDGLCSARDVRPHLASHLVGPASNPGGLRSMPTRARATIPGEAAHMAAACSDGYFFCRRGSQACADDQGGAHPMDTQEGRSIYYLCSEWVCREAHLSPDSQACAGLLLALAHEVTGAIDRGSRQHGLPLAHPRLQNRTGDGRLYRQSQALLATLDQPLNPRTLLADACPDLDLLRGGMAHAGVGYCDVTEDAEGDCENGNKGSFQMAADGDHGGVLRDHSGCIERCRRCARCNFVSVSAANHDCSWFHTCTLPLGLDMGGAGYLTFAVRSMPQQRRGIGIRRDSNNSTARATRATRST